MSWNCQYSLEQITTGEQSQVKVKDSDALVTIETRFGWAVQGPVVMSSMCEATCMHVGIHGNPVDISNQLRAFWELESLGISTKGEETPDDARARESFDKTIRLIDERYEVALPWRQDTLELSDNKQRAQKSFETLKRKLKHDVMLFKRYNYVIEEYTEQGM